MVGFLPNGLVHLQRNLCATSLWKFEKINWDKDLCAEQIFISPKSLYQCWNDKDSLLWVLKIFLVIVCIKQCSFTSTKNSSFTVKVLHANLFHLTTNNQHARYQTIYNLFSSAMLKKYVIINIMVSSERFWLLRVQSDKNKHSDTNIFFFRKKVILLHNQICPDIVFTRLQKSHLREISPNAKIDFGNLISVKSLHPWLARYQ